ncbi:uncharacterized protein G2W53_041415 [Senna tora]|uniref:Uncharacterized protein n=1 Tax=Senna tora TaxID=362788 RepID=A0A834SS36_9FABA|nr:uncharacterized protein G2W53_041415 [Senna tora]
MAKQGKDYREEVRQALAVTRTMLELTDVNLEAVKDEVVFSRGCLGGGEEDSLGKIAQKHDKDLTKRRQHDLTHLPCDPEPHSSIKSTRIPKYNAKQSV